MSRQLDNAFEIFKSCFGYLGLNREQFSELSGFDDSEMIECDGGFALINKDCVKMLIVSAKKQGKGLGTSLLSKCERVIVKDGYDRAVLGCELLHGAPTESCGFFEKRGYTFGSEYAEMCVDLSHYSDPLPENSTRFGFYNGEIEQLQAAVADVDEDWVQYVDGNNEYFCGYADENPISFCIFEDNVINLASGGAMRCGSVGCVGTVPQFRKHGIGLKMVSLALEELKRRSCDKCFIHMTHLWDWYARLGAKVILKYREGEKTL